MDTLVALPLEFQIILISGYVGYKIFVTGRGSNHSIEESILQILTFGSVGRLTCLALGLLYIWLFPSGVLTADDSRTVAVGAITLFASITIAVIWRKWGLAAASDLMDALGVYRDDHEYSTWASLQNASAVWTFIQVHLTDGRILESHFGGLPDGLPTDKIILNTDGLAFYVTKTYDPDGNSTQYDAAGNDRDYPVTYLPRDSIAQIDLGLRRKSS